MDVYCSLMTIVKRYWVDVRVNMESDRCRCCYTEEALETLQKPIYEIFLNICYPQDANTDRLPVITCFKCHDFLREVYRFKRKCLEVEQLLKNRLDKIKTEPLQATLVSGNVNEDKPSDEVDVKMTDIKIELDEVDFEMNLAPESSQEDVCHYPEVPFLSINEVVGNYSQHEPQTTGNKSANTETDENSTDQSKKIMTMDLNAMRIQFYSTLQKRKLKPNTLQMSFDRYKKIMEEVKAAKNRDKKLSKDSWLLKHYDVLIVDSKEHLVTPAQNHTVLHYIPLEELFDILFDTHLAIGHGGRDRMKKKLHSRYKNISYNEIQTFVNLCQFCLQKRKSKKKRES